MNMARLTHNLPAGPVITAPEAEAVVASGEDFTVVWQLESKAATRPS